MSGRAFAPAWLSEDGIVGFSSIEDIRFRRSTVPVLRGVYVVYREHLNPVEFLDKSTGGWFKGRDPSVPIDQLKAKWIDEAHVLYIGKADAGRVGARGIRVRLGE